MTIAVPPAYYAHLAAYRARFYMEPEALDSGTMTSDVARRRRMDGPSTSTPPPVVVRSLPAVKENVKKVMFYC